MTELGERQWQSQVGKQVHREETEAADVVGPSDYQSTETQWTVLRLLQFGEIVSRKEETGHASERRRVLRQSDISKIGQRLLHGHHRIPGHPQRGHCQSGGGSARRRQLSCSENLCGPPVPPDGPYGDFAKAQHGPHVLRAAGHALAT